MTDADLTRELALKVMGWPTVTTYQALGEAQFGATGAWAAIDEPGFGGTVYPHQAYTRNGNAWLPLDSIEQAWEVRDRLAKQGYRVEIAALPHCGKIYQHCRVIAPAGTPYSWQGEASTSAPRAICLAALRAVGVEPEGEQ